MGVSTCIHTTRETEQPDTCPQCYQRVYHRAWRARKGDQQRVNAREYMRKQRSSKLIPPMSATERRMYQTDKQRQQRAVQARAAGKVVLTCGICGALCVKQVGLTRHLREAHGITAGGARSTPRLPRPRKTKPPTSTPMVVASVIAPVEESLAPPPSRRVLLPRKRVGDLSEWEAKQLALTVPEIGLDEAARRLGFELEV
jgi:uncharacterized C2H2 Zn-finger protein